MIWWQKEGSVYTFRNVFQWSWGVFYCGLTSSLHLPIWIQLKLNKLALLLTRQPRTKRKTHMKLALLPYFRKWVKCSSQEPAAQCQHAYLFQGWIKTHKKTPNVIAAKIYNRWGHFQLGTTSGQTPQLRTWPTVSILMHIAKLSIPVHWARCRRPAKLRRSHAAALSLDRLRSGPLAPLNIPSWDKSRPIQNFPDVSKKALNNLSFNGHVRSWRTTYR